MGDITLGKIILKLIQDNFFPIGNEPIKEQTPLALVGIDDTTLWQFLERVCDAYGIEIDVCNNNIAAFSTVGDLVNHIAAKVESMKRELFLPMEQSAEIVLQEAQYLTSASQADIYTSHDKVIKLFYLHKSGTTAYREARKQMAAYRLGLPVPAVYDIIDGERTAIIMDYISGPTMGSQLLENENLVDEYVDLFIDVQSRMHDVSAVLDADFPLQKSRIISKITETNLADKSNLNEYITLAQKIDNQTSLCHGDFHFLNMILKDGRAYVIDWQDACRGNSKVDVCRSYLLLLLHKPDFADIYLQKYCKHHNILATEVLRWLPLNAAVRLCDNIEQDDKAKLFALIAE